MCVCVCVCVSVSLCVRDGVRGIYVRVFNINGVPCALCIHMEKVDRWELIDLQWAVHA